MTAAGENRQILLAARPRGMPDASCWLNGVASYVPSVGIGEVMRASAPGQLVASGSDAFQVGDFVTGFFGVQEYAIVDAEPGVSKVTAWCR